MVNHYHNGTDAPKLVAGEAIEGLPLAQVTEVTGTADATYSSNEQTMINDLKDTVNDLIDKLQSVGILK